MKTVTEALSEVLQHFAPLPSVDVLLRDALGLYLATDVFARRDAPPFDNSAMDGYALCAGDTSPGATLPVMGESKAGSSPQTLKPLTTMRVFTGAPMPVGADAVAKQEDVVRSGNEACFAEPTKHGQYVRAKGQDLRKGALLLAAGSKLGPGEIALLASQSYITVPARARPRVAIVSTGDELRDVSETLAPGQVVNCNAYLLAAAVELAGGIPVVLETAPDNLPSVERLVEQALQFDVAISSGGVSVGEHDHMRRALETAGVSLRFWKIAMKPGKPVVLGVRDGVPFLGLPGNPVSAWVTFLVFAWPALRKMLGASDLHLRQIDVEIATPRTRRAGRTEFMRARAELSGGKVLAHPLPRQGSGTINSIANVDLLLIVSRDVEQLAFGDQLRALVIPGRLTAGDAPRDPALDLNMTQDC